MVYDNSKKIFFYFRKTLDNDDNNGIINRKHEKTKNQNQSLFFSIVEYFNRDTTLVVALSYPKDSD